MKLAPTSVVTSSVISINFVDLKSIIKYDNEIIRIIGIHKDGYLDINKRNRLFANTYWSSSDLVQYQFYTNLNCEPDRYEIDVDNKWEEKSSYYEYKTDSLEIRLSSLINELNVLLLTIETGINKLTGNRIHFFALGVDHIEIARVDPDKVFINIKWTCEDHIEQVIYSLSSNKLVY
jgi:hypothetical protein